MTDSADPRIALMQKWSAENPELLAQAGLASSLETSTHLGVFAKGQLDKHRDAINAIKGIDLPHVWDEHAMHMKNNRIKALKKRVKDKLMSMTKDQIVGIAKAAQSGVLTVSGNHNTTQHTHDKKKKKHVKYYNLDPHTLSQNTEKAREEIKKTISNARGVKSVLDTHFRESDLISHSELSELLKSYDKFYVSDSEQDFDNVYSELFIFYHKSKSILINGAYIPTGGRFQNQDFHVYGPETRPIMQKAFIIKTLYHILFKRYTKTIPPIKKQTPQHSATVKGMLDQFNRIDKPYKDLYDYGRALRIKKAEAKSAKKDFPAVSNASLRSEFDDSQNTFSMATPYT
jgi:hypothetical protein